MSISCEYDQLKYPFFVGDVTRQISIEVILRMPENLPRIKTIIGGDFQVGVPEFSVTEDSLKITGWVYPQIVFTADKPEHHKHQHHQDNYDEHEYSEEHEKEGLLTEYGVNWHGEDGVAYEEKIEVPGLRPEMLVQLEITALTGVFEKNGPDLIAFKGEVEIIIHSAYHQTAAIIRDINIQALEKVNLVKERVMVEELMGMKKVTIPMQANLILPNLKPGVARILKTLIKPSNISQEMGRNRLFVKGVLEVLIVYVGADDEGNPTEIFANEWSRSLGAAIPFETYIDMDDSEGEFVAIPKITAQNIVIEPRIPHELRCQMELGVEVSLSRLSPKEMVVEATPSEGESIDNQRYLLNLEEYSGEMLGEINLEQQIELPRGLDSMERILAYHGTPREVMIEASDEKVLIEGTLDLWLMYITDNEEQRLAIATWEKSNNNRLPLTGVMDFPGLQAGTLLHTHIMLDSMQVEMIDGNHLKLSGVIKIRAFARMPRAIFVLRDCAMVTPVDPATRPSMLFYVVQPGDTLWKIARYYQTTVNTLVKVNQIANPDYIEVGQKLLIPKKIINT